MLNFYGTDAGLVYDTLSELFERSFDPECTSKNCPGISKTVHYGCELIYIEGSSNLIEESIATWESGKSRNCPASFQDEPLDHTRRMTVMAHQKIPSLSMSVLEALFTTIWRSNILLLL